MGSVKLPVHRLGTVKGDRMNSRIAFARKAEGLGVPSQDGQLSERGTKRRTPGARCFCEACAPEVYEGLKEAGRSRAPKKSPGREVSAQPRQVLVPEIGKCGLCGLRFPQ